MPPDVASVTSTVPTDSSLLVLWKVINAALSPEVLQVNLASPPLATLVVSGGEEISRTVSVAAADLMFIVPHFMEHIYSPAASEFTCKVNYSNISKGLVTTQLSNSNASKS